MQGKMQGAEKRSHGFRARHRDGLLAAGLLAIPLGWWLVISAFPLGFGIALGFLDWTSLAVQPAFNGLKNYYYFFTSSLYYLPLIRSFTIGGASFLLTTAAGFFVALFLNRIAAGKGVLRTIWYVPVVTSAVATTQIFNILLEPDPYSGALNSFLVNVLGREAIIWKDSPFWSVSWILIYSVWKGVGGSALLWLAGMQSIDRSLSEAAAVDGANKWQDFIYVVMPQLLSIAVFIVITGFTGAMQIYEQVLFISNGGPYGKTEVLAFRIMKDAFTEHNFGMAGASSMVMTLVTFVFSFFAFRSMSEKVK